MPQPDAFAEYVLEQHRAFGAVQAKRMFGGYGIYHQGRMFGLIADGEFYYKVDDSNRQDYVDASCSPFVYEGNQGKKVTLPYWTVPEDVLEVPEELAEWAQKAYVVAAAAQSAKPKKRKKAG